MKYLINSIYFYFLLPIYGAIALLLIFFNVPGKFYFSIFNLIALITIPLLVSNLFFPVKMQLKNYYVFTNAQSKYRLVIFSLCFVIVAFGPLDIYINGFKLIHPESYAKLDGFGRYIRHIAIMCWILIPVAYIFIKNPSLKRLFISYAIIYPILIIDRNRLLLSCYSLFIFFTLNKSNSNKGILNISNNFLLYLIPIICLIVFAIIGAFRSGDAFVVQTSGILLIEDYYPLANYFFVLPKLLQQIVLYITTPIFNFVTVSYYNFINPEFLISQFSPFTRDLDVYIYAPILVTRYSVGTELYPFLLYGGLSLALGAFLILLSTFNLSVFLLKKHSNIFTWLIFIKISYSALMMGFAPQFFILYNLVFVMLMIFLWLIAELRETQPFIKKQMQF